MGRLSDLIPRGAGGATVGPLPALALAILPLCFIHWGGVSPHLIIMTALAGLMAGFDLATRRIPNPLCAIGAAGGLFWGLMAGGWDGFLGAGLSALIGFGFMVIFFIFGALGAGDVKAMGALCAWLTPWGAVTLIVFTSLAGGVMALIQILGRRRDASPASLPYGLAMAMGAFALVLSGGGS